MLGECSLPALSIFPYSCQDLCFTVCMIIGRIICRMIQPQQLFHHQGLCKRASILRAKSHLKIRLLVNKCGHLSLMPPLHHFLSCLLLRIQITKSGVPILYNTDFRPFYVDHSCFSFLFFDPGIGFAESTKDILTSPACCRILFISLSLI